MRTGHDSGNIGSGSGGSAYRAPSSHRKKMRALGGACLLAFFLSLCIRVTIPGLVSPLRALSCLVLWMRLAISRAIGTQPWLGRFALIEAAGGPLYYDSVSRFLTTLVSFACGMLLALSGHIFQTAFKNPLAAPAILGVAAGVRVGILLVFLQYGISSLNMPLERYIYCYSAALLMLGTTLLLAKVSSGKRKFSTTDLLIVAAILSQVVSAVYSWRVFTLENDDALVLARLGNQIVTNTAPESLAALGLVLLLCIPPFFLLRFSFNIVALDSDEAGSMGLDTRTVRLVSIVLGSVMAAAAMIHCGMVAMVSLIVPFLSRGIFGVESRRLFWGNLLLGGLMLLLCKDIAALIPFPGEGMPVGAIVELVAIPAFIAVLATRRRTWE